MSDEKDTQIEILTQLGRMSEKLSSIDKRLGKNEESIESVIHILKGDGVDRAGLAALTKANTSKLEDLEIQIAQNQARMEKMETAQNELIKACHEIQRISRENPSLLWMLRFRTRETVLVIIMIFIFLSLWWVSGWRQPVLEWLGLPIF